jgi:hypothetical protein
MPRIQQVLLNLMTNTFLITLLCLAIDYMDSGDRFQFFGLAATLFGLASIYFFVLHVICHFVARVTKKTK